MLSHPFVFMVVAAMVASLVCVADTGHATRERRYYRDHVFSWNYDKVEVASKGWKANEFREKVMPTLLKIGGTVYTTVSTPLKVISYMKEAIKLAKRVTSENYEFYSHCDSEPMNVTSRTRCTVNTLVLGTLALSTSITGTFTEAYIRTRLNSTSEKFKLFNDGIFQLITEAISTELVMLGQVFKMTLKFGNVLVARYFQAPLPVKGTESDFVKACDNVYAAVADFSLMSRMVVNHTVSSIRNEINSTTSGLAPEFLKYVKEIMDRGIPREYANSPFPPLSYYWDMAALEYAVSILSDMNVITNQIMNEVVEENADHSFLDKTFISNVAYAACGGLADTINHLKRNELKAALKSATDGLRMAVYAYHEAGLDIPREQGSEALQDNFESFLESLKPLAELSTLVDFDKLVSVSGVAAVFGVANKDMKVSYRELYNFFVPADYDQLMTMVTDVSDSVTKTCLRGYRFNMLSTSTGSDVPDLGLSKLDLSKLVHVVKRQVLDSSEASSSEDSEPDVSEQSEIPPVEQHNWASASLGPNGPKFADLLDIILKHGSIEFLFKMQDPAACEADPKCKETYTKIATKIGELMGVDIGADGESLPTPLSPLRGGKRPYGQS